MPVREIGGDLFIAYQGIGPVVGHGDLQLVVPGPQKPGDVQRVRRVPQDLLRAAVDLDGGDVVHRAQIQDDAAAGRELPGVEPDRLPVGGRAGEIVHPLFGMLAEINQFRERQRELVARLVRKRNVPGPIEAGRGERFRRNRLLLAGRINHLG